MFPRAYQRDFRNPFSIAYRLPRPFGESRWIDAAYVAIIAFLQSAVLPTILPQDFAADLLTPWLAVAVVLLPANRSLPLILLSALLIETHSAAPAGLYLTVYWMMGTAITLSRNAISWTNRAPWLSLVILSETWMFAAEFLVAVLAGQEPPIEFRFYIFQALRIAVSTIFGYLVAMKLAPDVRRGKTTDG